MIHQLSEIEKILNQLLTHQINKFEAKEKINNVLIEKQIVENVEILKARWQHWDAAFKSGLYDKEEKSPYCDGFTHGAKWMQKETYKK
jgi:hypothetical protein